MDEIYELITKMEWFSSFLEFAMCMYFCSGFMDRAKNADNRNSIRSTGIAFVWIILANLVFMAYGKQLELSYQKKIFFFILCVLMQWIYFHRMYFLTLVVSLLYSEILMVLELVGEIAFWKVSLLPYQEEIVFLFWRILATTVSVVFLHGLAPKTQIPKAYLLVIAVFTLVSLVWNWTLTGAEGVISMPEFFYQMIMPLMVIVFFLFQIVVVFFVFKIAETHQQKQTTALIELSNKMLEKSLDETEQTFELWRQSVHDYKNHVIVLKQLADEQRLDEIQAFLEVESDSIRKQLFMIRTGNSVVDTLVNLKRALAEHHGIAFLVHGILPEQMVVEDMDLANILGNLLDNAIEACIKEQDAYIDITIKQEKNFFLLSVRNKCANAFKKEIQTSSKEHPEFHGIGLKSVKRAVKKYDGQMQVEQTPQEFVVNIMIQNIQEN